MTIDKSPLGKTVTYSEEYSPELLCAIPRSQSRDSWLTEGEALPFNGFDQWNLWELSWLDPTGKPQVRVGRLQIPCNSPFLVESKSLKLYLNSLNFKKFATTGAAQECIVNDLSHLLDCKVTLEILPLASKSLNTFSIEGDCIDQGPFSQEMHSAIQDGSEEVTEVLYSHLFRSCCPVTGQPDWATVVIDYKGSPLNRAALLTYLVSFRKHRAFHEACVEKIFVDLLSQCELKKLSVMAFFNRRGGIDISPYRSIHELPAYLPRLSRQ